MKLFSKTALVALCLFGVFAVLPAALIANPATFSPEVQSILERRCLKCHAKSAFMKTPEAMRKSESKAKIEAGKMPPAKKEQAQGFELADKAALLAFLSGKELAPAAAPAPAPAKK
jgi:hypothetical protein